MQRSVEVSAKTVEDALAKALADLGLERDDVSVEIIERGKKGVFGIGAMDAVIRVSYEGPDEAPAAPKAEAPKSPATPKAEAPKAPAAPKAEGTQAEQTEAFLKGLLEHMGVEAELTITDRPGGR